MKSGGTHINSVWAELRRRNPKLPEKVWSYRTYVLFNDKGEAQIDIFVEHIATDSKEGPGKVEIFCIRMVPEL